MGHPDLLAPDTRWEAAMTDLSPFTELVPLDHGLCVLSTLRPDGGVQATVVNAGVVHHPRAGAPAVGLVATGGSRELRHLRADPGPRSSPGPAGSGPQSRGPPRSSVPTTRTPTSTPGPAATPADIFQAAGGTHDDWDAYDRVMADERRAAVCSSPRRAYTNPQRPADSPVPAGGAGAASSRMPRPPRVKCHS